MHDDADSPRRRALLKGGVVAALFTTAAGSADAAGDVTPRHRESVLVAMRDGVRVAMSIWLPEGPGPFPAILMRSLDRRRYVRRLGMLDDLRAAGYAFVSSDVRGRFESGGTFDPTYGEQDGRDGYDTIEWLAQQSWCDGRIGTYGLSHQSSYQVSTALQKPPHLRAMATWTGGWRNGASSRTENAHPPASGGVTNLATLMVWLPSEAGAALDKLAGSGQDVSEARRVLRRMRTHPAETFAHLPLREAPITRYAGLRELFDYRLARDATPAAGGGSAFEKIDVPVFHECGWYDHAAWGQFHGFTQLQTRAGTALAREHQYMTAGPWMHAMVFQDRLGDMYFGGESDNDGSGINRRQIRFFDKFVKGEDIALPKVRWFLMGANEWRESPQWPPAAAVRMRWHLASGGRIGPAPTPSAGSDTFTYDPLKPVPTIGGSFNGPMSIPGMIPGPLEQSAIERRDDVLIYTSAPFERDTELTGPVVLQIAVSTSAADTDFTGKLCLVYPDDRSYNIVDAIVRLSGRGLLGKRETVTAGEVYTLRMGLGHTAQLVRRGERLRLQIASSNFPQYDRNMNTGNAVGTDRDGVRARQTVHHGGEHASFLELPLAPA